MSVFVDYFPDQDAMIVDLGLKEPKGDYLEPHHYRDGSTVVFTDEEGRVALVEIMSGAGAYDLSGLRGTEDFRDFGEDPMTEEEIEAIKEMQREHRRKREEGAGE